MRDCQAITRLLLRRCCEFSSFHIPEPGDGDRGDEGTDGSVNGATCRWCRAQFVQADGDESGEGLGTCRALACELVACELASNLSSQEALQYLCYEVPNEPEEQPETEDTHTITENTPLTYGTSSTSGLTGTGDLENSYSKPGYVGLNTLEIAVLADAKKFISHQPVQRIITGMYVVSELYVPAPIGRKRKADTTTVDRWDGSISFWKSLDVHGAKRPHFYNPR